MKHVKSTVFLIFMVWAVYIINYLYELNLNQFGILPRTQKGLVGIVASPFLHADIVHIVSNTVPLFVLTLVTFIFYNRIALGVVVFSILLSGLLVWAFGRSNYHIGASSLVYALASFLFFMGLFKRSLLSIAIALGVAFLYGGLVMGIFPNNPNISWEGHLFGAVAGGILAYSFRNYDIK